MFLFLSLLCACDQSSHVHMQILYQRFVFSWHIRVVRTPLIPCSAWYYKLSPKIDIPLVCICCVCVSRLAMQARTDHNAESAWFSAWIHMVCMCARQYPHVHHSSPHCNSHSQPPKWLLHAEEIKTKTDARGNDRRFSGG
jgi:hypothetical protein